jgi:hypothetical protein
MEVIVAARSIGRETASAPLSSDGHAAERFNAAAAEPLWSFC